MTRLPKRRRLLVAASAALLLALALAALLLRGNSADGEPRAARERPGLLLLTSLPIVFPEEFTLEGGGSPALEALEELYRVTPVSTADAGTLEGHGLLLIAQPNAQTAEALVELDEWVRSGGRLLLLADPVLKWPSERPLGDVLRPPLAFADTGLLGHWGLRLDAPERLGPASFEIDGRSVHSLSPGSLTSTGEQCRVEAEGLLARCRIGGGWVTVIADADFIDVERQREPARSGNLAVLLQELARLAH